tara:strand:- start:1270 stop:2094 length:825 start_codon:yes stop_codon:yes gene_type:complete
MEKNKILYVTQEINPFLVQTEISDFVRTLAQGVHETDKEIRIFMPRFGVINERRHQLHEVIRLSGMNLIVNDYDHPLIIKVASIPQIRIQVYFIDNEEYFKRKFIFSDENSKLFNDNDERSMFFCRGVLETVKKLGWIPDIIHCHGWMSALMPLYLNTIYENDPHFTNSKSIYSLYREPSMITFNDDFAKKLAFEDISVEELNLGDTIDINKLHEIAIKWSDAISICTNDISDHIENLISTTEKPLLNCHNEEDTIDEHQDFYEKVLSENGVFA